MKFNSKIIREAHKLAKETKAEYPEVDYKLQFGLNLKYLLSEVKEDKGMVELIGSENKLNGLRT
ncbi:hypothetical protein [Clostridium sp. BJN0013]|uniref:hypothetical protein n=1 Tax=Clostridium sp. BJN0013 TaxID=3236840 RepID=UPI0034C5FFE3